MYCRPKIPSLPRPSIPLKSSSGVIRLVWTIVSILKVISSNSTPHRTGCVPAPAAIHVSVRVSAPMPDRSCQSESR